MARIVVTEFSSLDGVMEAPGGEDFKYPGWSFEFDRGEDGNQFKLDGFYTEILGFVTKTDVPVGEARWLTFVSPDDPDGTELLLEPDGHPAAKPFKQALVDDGIPYTSFAVDDVKAEYDRLRALGVRFTQEPLEMQSVTTAVLDDTCGNLIQIARQR